MHSALLFLSLLLDSSAIQESEIVLSADCFPTGNANVPVDCLSRSKFSVNEIKKSQMLWYVKELTWVNLSELCGHIQTNIAMMSSYNET